MYRMIAIATSVAVALGIAGAFAAADLKPTDPQIAISHILPVCSTSRRASRLSTKARMKTSAPSLSEWLGTILR